MQVFAYFLPKGFQRFSHTLLVFPANHQLLCVDADRASPQESFNTCKGKTKRPAIMQWPASIICGSTSLSLRSANPSFNREGFAESWCGLRGRLDYFAAAFFFAVCLSGSGLRSCGFTALSSTGVVPCTSFVKVAPEGTR